MYALCSSYLKQNQKTQESKLKLPLYSCWERWILNPTFQVEPPVFQGKFLVLEFAPFPVWIWVITWLWVSSCPMLSQMSANRHLLNCKTISLQASTYVYPYKYSYLGCLAITPPLLFSGCLLKTGDPVLLYAWGCIRPLLPPTAVTLLLCWCAPMGRVVLWPGSGVKKQEEFSCGDGQAQA